MIFYSFTERSWVDIDLLKEANNQIHFVIWYLHGEFLFISDLGTDKKPLSWNTRMKIAVAAARGLEYLHCKANPPVIYRDLKSANILLDNDFNPKLSDFGLAKLGPVGDNTHVSTRVMGTYGYCAPEYAMSGKLTLKSDIYSFGVVLLELITGRKVIDTKRRPGEQNLVAWVSTLIKFFAQRFYTCLYLVVLLFLFKNNGCGIRPTDHLVLNTYFMPVD